MKKRILIISLMVLLIALGVAVYFGFKNREESTTPNISTGESLRQHIPLSFNSTDDLIEALKTGEQIAYATEKDGSPLVFSSILEMIDRGEIPVPKYQGKTDFLKEDAEEPYEVDVFCKETFLRSWIWYSDYYNEDSIIIGIMYLDEDEIAFSENHSCAELIEYIDPTFPNIHNKEEFDEKYNSISQKDIQLADRKVQALVIDLIDGYRDRIFFVYDDLLVNFYAKVSAYPDDFFSKISIDYIKVE